MEKFKEIKSVEVSNVIVAILMIAFLLCLFLSIFWHEFLIGILILPCSIPFAVFAFTASKRDEYTRNFIKLIENRLSKDVSLDDLKHTEMVFTHLAIENDRYCLSFPISLRKIHNEIICKIEILEKQNTNPPTVK